MARGGIHSTMPIVGHPVGASGECDDGQMGVIEACDLDPLSLGDV